MFACSLVPLYIATGTAAVLLALYPRLVAELVQHGSYKSKRAAICHFAECMLLLQIGGRYSRHSSVWCKGFRGCSHRRVDADFAHLRAVLRSSRSGLEGDTLLALDELAFDSYLSASFVRLPKSRNESTRRQTIVFEPAPSGGCSWCSYNPMLSPARALSRD